MDEQYWERARAALTDPDRHKEHVPVDMIPPPSRGNYTPPAPPPADMPIDPDKWRSLDRKTRRALLRHHRKVAR